MMDKQKAIIFGAGDLGKKLYNDIKNNVNVLYVVDNDSQKFTYGLDHSERERMATKHGGYFFAEDIVIKSPLSLLEEDFDIVYITVRTGLTLVRKQLINELNIPEYKIDDRAVFATNFARQTFVENFSEYATAHNIIGSIAEIGVFQGEFTKEINKFFKDRTLYLFDTFSGFDARDIGLEHINNFTSDSPGEFSDTSIELVLNRIPHPEQCIVKKGYFPDTFDLHDEQFCFVSLDVDLYQPTKAGLELFYPKISKGGVILIDDYFSERYLAIRNVVDEFCAAYNIQPIPIGDGYGIAVIKQ